MVNPKNLGDEQLFREDFLNAQSVVDNGGIIVGAPTFSDGIVLGGTNDWVTYGDTQTYKWMHGAVNPTGFKWTISFSMSLPTPEPDAIYGLFSTGNISSAGIGVDIFFDDRSAEGRSRLLGILITRGVGGQSVVSAFSNNNVYPNDSDEHAIVIIYDQSLASVNIKVYIDGVSISIINPDKTGNVPSVADSTHELHVGNLGSETSPAVAKIKDLKIIKDVAWTPEEVLDEFQGDTYEEVDASKFPMWLPLKSQYNDGAQKTSNLGTVDDAKVGDGSTASTFPTVKTYNKSFSFDGGDYLDVGGLSDFSFVQNTGIFSTGCWVYIDTPGADALNIFMGNTVTATEKGFFFGLENRVSQSSPATFKLSMGSGSSIILSLGTTLKLTHPGWHFCAVTGDATNVKFYLDGEHETGTNTMGGLSTGDSTRTLNVGRTNAASAFFPLTGDMKYPFINDFTMTPRQMRWMYEKGKKEFNI